MLLKSAFN